jgi:hypothetical protein
MAPLNLIKITLASMAIATSSADKVPYGWFLGLAGEDGSPQHESCDDTCKRVKDAYGYSYKSYLESSEASKYECDPNGFHTIGNDAMMVALMYNNGKGLGNEAQRPRVCELPIEIALQPGAPRFQDPGSDAPAEDPGQCYRQSEEKASDAPSTCDTKGPSHDNRICPCACPGGGYGPGEKMNPTTTTAGCDNMVTMLTDGTWVTAASSTDSGAAASSTRSGASIKIGSGSIKLGSGSIKFGNDL